MLERMFDDEMPGPGLAAAEPAQLDGRALIDSVAAAHRIAAWAQAVKLARGPSGPRTGRCPSP
jgi:hypothetical protein